MSAPFSVNKRLRSFRFAFRGLRNLIVDQHNARIHAVATVLVLGLAVYFAVTKLEWGLLILAIASVWMAEALNSALEYLADAAVPEQHPLVQRAKDVAAAGVLLAACGAAIVGILVFAPYLLPA